MWLPQCQASEELEGRYRSSHEPQERSWWQILWLLARGQRARQVAESTGYSRYWIGQLARRYNTQGPVGMQNHARSTSQRQEPLLSPAHQEELRQALTGSPFGGGGEALWTGRAGAVAVAGAGWVWGPAGAAVGGHIRWGTA